MGLWDSLAKAVRVLSDERQLKGVPAGARKHHRASQREQREYEVEHAKQDEYGVGVPNLDDSPLPFEFTSMRFEKHYVASRETGEVERSEEYYLAAPSNQDDIVHQAGLLNRLIDEARTKVTALPADMAIDPGLIRVWDPARVPNDQERMGLSLFDVQSTTKTGKPSKHPVTLMILAGDSHGKISYLRDGAPGKVKVVCWKKHVGYIIEARMINGELSVSYVSRTTSEGVRERIFDYRSKGA